MRKNFFVFIFDKLLSETLLRKYIAYFLNQMTTTTLFVALVLLAVVLLFLWQPEKANNNNSTDTEIMHELPDFSGSLIRVQTAEELIQTLKLAPVVNNIKIHLGLSTENWNKDGLPLIHNFLLLVQRLPASESHHHAGDGGLACHTLDVAAMALKQSAGRSFPPNGKTEDIPRLTPVWKYGILVAALLHDVGKVLTGFNITLSDKDGKNAKTWLPDTGNMPINAYYNVDFLDENHHYTKHAEIGWSFFMTLVPESTRQWITDMSPDLVLLLRSYLSGCHNDSIIEELVKSADMASVSADLATGNRQRFANAKRTPLIEIIMDTLQEMLSDRGRYFTVARDAGGDLFCKGDTIYMISKNVPDYIRNYLQQNNPAIAESFPNDNNRIFDTLFEYNAIKPNPFDERKAITNIAVQFNKSDKSIVQTQFTVLAFPAKTLYPDGVYPSEFSGLLEIVKEKVITSAPQNEESRQPENADTEIPKENNLDNYIIPPMMSNPFANQPINTDTEDPATSLESLLGIEATSKNSGSLNNEATSENTEVAEDQISPNTATDFTSIDDLLKLTGLIDEESDTVSGKLKQETAANSAPTNQPEKTEPVRKQNKKENQQETMKKLKSIFGDDFNGKQNNNQTVVIEADHKEDDAPIEMPRPIPVKTPISLDNIHTAISDIRIKKALHDKYDEETSPFKQQGLKFLHWLVNGLADGSISFNNPQSFIHFIESGMLLVSPASFRAFTGEFNNKNPDCIGRKTQMGFELLNLVERGSRRTSLYRAFNLTEEPLFFCYLIPNRSLHYLIQMSTRPANNPNLSIIPADELPIRRKI